MDSKPFYKSRTFWFNLGIGFAGVLQTQLETVVVSNATLAAVLAIGNLLLRAVTRVPVTVKATP